MIFFFLACKTEISPQPLNLPEDPAEFGVPVGVTTITSDAVTLEVWYPATDDTPKTGESVDFDPFIPDNFRDQLETFDLPAIPTIAVRDATLRPWEEPYPVVFFSHGFGGTRIQSVDYTTHLASRGYVVVAADHPGRMMGDILPCIFEPALDGCDLSAFANDPAVDDITAALDLVETWNDEGFFAGALDLEHQALSGHSAGGGTTGTVGEQDERLDALLSLAAGAEVERAVPVAWLGGTCDSFVLDSDLVASAEGRALSLVRIAGAGHLAFSDLCSLEMLDFAAEYLEGREDINASLLDLLIQLGSDGCPGLVPAAELNCGESFLPLEVSTPIIRYYSTVFFDETLRGQGPGVQGGIFPEVLD